MTEMFDDGERLQMQDLTPAMPNALASEENYVWERLPP